MSKSTQVSILGDGGWGTALALVSERIGHKTMLWSAFPDYAEELRTKRENKKFLPGIKIPTSVQITSDLKEVVQFGQFIVLAIPSQFLRAVLFRLQEYNLSDKILVSVTKGIEKKTLLRPSQIIQQLIKDSHLAVLSGPSHAEEVARRIPTLVVSASQEPKTAEAVQNTFRDSRFRIYVQSDVVGVELAAALKNVIAIAAGVCDGLGFGSNTKAALVTRGLLEITHLGVQMGANPNTFFGLSGLGDLVTTCISEYGRNRKVGELLGQGKTIEEILKGMDQVAEGVETTRSAMELAKKYNVDVPIISEMYEVLFQGKKATEALESLMMREAKEELRSYRYQMK